MSERDIAWQERRLEEVLDTDLDPMSKVQQIVRLGFSEEMATNLVERYQYGLNAPVYYERLDYDDYDDDSADVERTDPTPDTTTQR